MSAIIIENKIVHYEVLGRGKPIIFLHGWVGSWRYWIPAMQAASTSYRAYALDLWGFGDTAKESSRYTLEKQTDLLDQFLNEMGIGKVALIGHGLGAAVSLLYASKHSFVVDRVMVIGLPMDPKSLLSSFGNTAPPELADHFLAQDTTTKAARDEAVKTDQLAIKTSLEDLQFINLLELSKQIETASLMVHGFRDPVIPSPSLGRSADLPNTLHHIVFEKSGHFPMIDQPNKFNRLVNDFLSLPSGSSPQQLQIKDEWKRRVR